MVKLFRNSGIKLQAVIVFFLIIIFSLSNPYHLFAGEPEGIYKNHKVQLVNCKEELDEFAPHRVVFQIINNTFYKWREYQPHDDVLSIYLEEPYEKALSAAEAKLLLQSSREWKRVFMPDDSMMEIIKQGELAGYETIDRSLEYVTEEIFINSYGERPFEAVYHPGNHAENQSIYKSSRQPYHNMLVQQADTPGIMQTHTPMTDNRVKVSIDELSSYPFNTVGFIGVEFPSGAHFRGTGFLISPFTALTNGHIVYDPVHGGWLKDLIFNPGQHEISPDKVILPYGSHNITSASTTTGYINYAGDINKSRSYDLAAVFFPDKIAGIDTFMPLVFDHTPKQINLAGYPAYVRNNYTESMWHSVGEVIYSGNHLLEYLAYSSGGNSGGPVWEYCPQSDANKVVAVTAYTESHYAYSGGPRLNSLNQDLIEEWMLWIPEGMEEYVLTMEIVGRGNTTPSMGEHELIGGTAVEIAAMPDAGWNFEKWVVNGVARTDNNSTIIMDADREVTAHFVRELPEHPEVIDDLGKSWLINFNREFLLEEIDEIIIEGDNTIINVEIEKEERHIIATPKEDYTPGESYYFRVSLSNNNRYRMKFTVNGTNI